MSIAFEPLPESGSSRGKNAAIAAQLRARPGEWAHVLTVASKATAGSTAHQIRTARLKPYAPVGAFEARSRKVDGEYRVYARFVGTSEPDAEQLTPPAEVWSVWRDEVDGQHALYATLDDARQGSIDCWQEYEPVCPDYSWRQRGSGWELLVGSDASGVYISRHKVYGQPKTDPEPPATLSDAERTMLTYALDQAQERIWSEDGFTDEDQAAVTALRRLTAEVQQP